MLALTRLLETRCQVNLTIESVSFAAHVDYEQNRDFLRKLAAPNVDHMCTLLPI